MSELLALVVLSAPCGCFEDPEALDGGDDPTAAESGTGTTPSTSADMEETIGETVASDPDASGSGSEGPPGGCGDGVVDGDDVCDDGNDVPGDGCEADCRPSPGGTYWTVIEDAGQYDAAYTVAVADDGDVIAAGTRGVSNTDDNPWVARYDAEGEPRWSEAAMLGTTSDLYRAVVVLADGRVLAAGTANDDGTDNGWLHANDPAGVPGWQDTFARAPTATRFDGIVVRPDGGLFAVGVADEGTQQSPMPTPLLVGYETTGEGWTAGAASVDDGRFFGTFGEIFAITPFESGYLAVGYQLAEPGGTSDAVVWRLDAEGYPQSEPATFGSPSQNDDFVDIAIEGAVVHVLGRRRVGDGVSDIWLVDLSVSDAIVIDWETTWSDAAFNVGNGMAVRDGARFIAASTNVGTAAEGFDSRVLRWDGTAAAPTWVVPFAEDAPGLDYASDVAVAPDGTIVAVGVVTLPGGNSSDAWIRKLAP